jgi:transaldolase/glucose-6-phosphate isomerase
MAETTLPSFAPGTLDARIDEPALAAAVAAALARADEERWSERLYDRDPTLWSDDAAVQEKISNRLGWLDLPVDFSDQVPALEAFGATMRDSGFTAAIVAGMGGSSLAPEVIASAFGDVDEWLTIRVLDSTDPDAVRAAWNGLDPLATLVVVGSKSGTTTETLAFEADAWQRIHDALRAHGARTESPGEFMVAVTDPGRSLAAIPHQAEMRGVFLNPESVGGRYSALSYVGLLPASLAGVDLDSFMASAVDGHDPGPPAAWPATRRRARAWPWGLSSARSRRPVATS